MEEYRIYIVKQGDTLESIAKELRVGIDDLVEFHNAHTLSGFISNDEWGLFMRNEILVPRDLTRMRLAYMPNIVELRHGILRLIAMTSWWTIAQRCR